MTCRHTIAPDGGYLVWLAWAKQMARTHVQTQCPACGLWAVWVPKNMCNTCHNVKSP